MAPHVIAGTGKELDHKCINVPLVAWRPYRPTGKRVQTPVLQANAQIEIFNADQGPQESIDWSCIAAGQNMGASGSMVFRTVILPFAPPFAFANFAFCFVLNLNEYITALMTVGFAIETPPIELLAALRYGYTPVIASITVVFSLINVTVFSLIACFANLNRIWARWAD